MHEFSIAVSIVEIAESAAVQHKAAGISEVEVEIGAASGIVIEALEFAWDSAAASSDLLKKSKLKICPVPLLAQCIRCHHRFAPDDLFEPCPVCRESGITILQGKELKVKSVTLDDGRSEI